MWLTETLARENFENTKASLDEISIGGAVTVATETSRQVNVLHSGGVIRRSKAGETGLVISCDDGTKVLIGTVSDTASSLNLSSGETYIGTETAHIHIKNDGSIELFGNISIVGSLSYNGVIL